MDEKQNQEKKIGYDKDTFGEINQGGYAQNNPYGQNHQYGQSKAQGDYAQNDYGQNAQQTSQDSSFYTAPRQDNNGFGIASMVLGILALIFTCGCLNIPLAILSIIFAIIHINRKTGSVGFAIAGLVTSTISVILMVIMVVLFWGVGSDASSWMYADTMPFEYFMDDDDGDDDDYDYDYGDDFDSDFEIYEYINDSFIDGHHYGQDL